MRPSPGTREYGELGRTVLDVANIARSAESAGAPERAFGEFA